MTSQLNNLKSQHIADEVKKVDDKVTKDSTDILCFESRLKQKEDTLNDLEREAGFNRGFWYYTQESYFLFDHLVEVEDQLVLGYQQEYRMTVKILTCFLWTILVTIHQPY